MIAFPPMFFGSSIPTFSPMNLPSPLLWIDSSDSSTISLSGSTVSQVRDKSGAANNATQTTASLQPAYVTSAVNGLNALSFSGNPYLQYANPTPTSNVTYWAVVVFTNGGGGGAIFGNSASQIFGIAANQLYYYVAGYGSNGPLTPDGVTHIVAANVTNGTATLYLDGTAIGTSSATPSSATLNLIGYRGTNPLEGYLCEAGVNGASLTTAQMNSLWTYLRSKWN